MPSRTRVCAYFGTLLGSGLALLASMDRRSDVLVLALYDVLAAVPLLCLAVLGRDDVVSLLEKVAARPQRAKTKKAPEILEPLQSLK